MGDKFAIVLVAAILMSVSVYALEQDETPPGNLQSNAVILSEPKCYSGLPTVVCYTKCKTKGLEAHCDSETMDCSCREIGLTSDIGNIPDNTDDHKNDQATSVLVFKPKCFLGLPTLACYTKCKMDGLESHCESDTMDCLCHQPSDLPESAAADNEDKDSEEDSDSSDIDAFVSFSDLCFFGYPSFSCAAKCHKEDTNNEPYCDQEAGLCLCRSPELPSETNPQHVPVTATSAAPPKKESEETLSSESDEDGKGIVHILFYVFHLNNPFSQGNETAGTATSTVTPPTNASSQHGNHTLHQDVVNVINAESVALKSWAFSHLVALLVVAFLALLILIELVACCKKSRRQSNMDSIFPTLGTPTKN